MAPVLAGMGSLFASGGAAAAGAGAAAGVASAGAVATGGISFAGILQGVTTVAGIVASMAASDQQADMEEAAAIDADTEKSVEVLEGIERRSSIKKTLQDAQGAQEVAYAASGVDLSFGTASQARKDANREADLAIMSDSSTETSNIRKLTERASQYRRSAKQTRSAGIWNALGQGASGLANFVRRG